MLPMVHSLAQPVIVGGGSPSGGSPSGGSPSGGSPSGGSPSGFNPGAVVFDGTSDNMYINSSGGSITRQWTLSFWWRPTAANQNYWFWGDNTGSDNDPHVQNRNISGGIRYRTSHPKNPSGWGLTHVSAVDETNTDILNQWNHIICSDDRTINTINGTHIYVNGVEVSNVQFKDATPTSTESVYDQYSFGNRDIKMSWEWLGIGTTNKSNVLLHGDFAEYYYDDTYHDLSNSSELAKFISGGKPVDLASSWPSGSQPKIYLTGSSSTFPTNLGTEGNCTVTGSLADSTNLPIEVGT